MKQTKFNWMTILMVAILSVGFVSCGKNDDDDIGGTSSIIGTWVCDFDTTTDYVICFMSDGTGYGYFTEDGLEEDDHFSYKVREDKITLYYHSSYADNYWNKTIEYDLSSDGKRLTLYGMDDNDMAVLHFTKRK